MARKCSSSKLLAFVFARLEVVRDKALSAFTGGNADRFFWPQILGCHENPTWYQYCWRAHVYCIYLNLLASILNKLLSKQLTLRCASIIFHSVTEIFMCFHKLFGKYADNLFFQYYLIDATSIVQDNTPYLRSLSLKFYLNRWIMSVFNNSHEFHKELFA